jgi:hypothetical protein
LNSLSRIRYFDFESLAIGFEGEVAWEHLFLGLSGVDANHSNVHPTPFRIVNDLADLVFETFNPASED